MKEPHSRTLWDLVRIYRLATVPSIWNTVSVLLLLSSASLIGCSPSKPAQELLDNVIVAMGGAEALLATEALVLEGNGWSYNIGENAHPGAELPRFEIIDYRHSIDFKNKRWQLRWIRKPRYLTTNDNKLIQTLGLDNGVAFNVNENGSLQRMSKLQGKLRGAVLNMHPIGFLQSALNSSNRVLNKRSIGQFSTLDLVTSKGDFTLYVDNQTYLPARIYSIGYSTHLGDVILETSFHDYKWVEGLHLPTSIIQKIDRFIVAELTLTKTIKNKLEDLSAPDTVKSTSAPAPRASVDVEEVARGLWLMKGNSHHSVLVEFQDHLVLVEAPQDDTRTLAVIERAKQLSPSKPLTHVINSHHHFDHSGGIRAAISEGLTIITHESNRTFFEDIASRPHTLSPDALQRNPQPLKLETISEKHVLEDGTRRIELYPIEGSQHAATLLMVYFPSQRILTVADVFTPFVTNTTETPHLPFASNLVENIDNYSLRVSRVMPLQGRTVPITELLSAAQMH